MMTQERINNVVGRYPAGKPTCFSYTQARRDVLALADELKGALAKQHTTRMLLESAEAEIARLSGGESDEQI